LLDTTGNGWALVKHWKDNRIAHSEKTKAELIRHCYDPNTNECITKKSSKKYKDGDKITMPYYKSWISSGTAHEKIEKVTYTLRQVKLTMKNE
jgi:hypothetical protein